MSKIIFTIVLTLALFIPLSAKADIATGLVGWWTMDSADLLSSTTIMDKTSNGYTGTLVGAPANVDGQIEQAFDFNGTTTMVTLGTMGDAVMKENQPVTISAWIYPRSLGESSAGRIVARESGTGLYFFTVTSNNRIDFEVYGTTGLYAMSQLNAFTFNQWTHVVVTWTGDTVATTSVNFYVNGSSNAISSSRNGVSLADNATQPITIGDRSQGGRAFDGLIDDVRVYNRVLSPSDVAELYNYTGADFTSNLVGWWKMDEGTSTLAYDSSGNNNTGTLSGTNKPTWIAGKIGPYALSCSGSSSYVNVPYSATLEPTPNLSIAMWIYYASVPASEQHPLTHDHNTSVFAYWFDIGRTSGILQFGKAGTSAGTTSAPYAGSWTHIVGTYDGTKNKLYVNGVLQKSASGSTPDYSGTYPVTFCSYSTGSYMFNGYIDDIRIYGRALLATDVNALYNYTDTVVTPSNFTRFIFKLGSKFQVKLGSTFKVQ